MKNNKLKTALDNLYLMVFALFIAYSFLVTTTFQIEWPSSFYVNVRDCFILLIFLRMIVSSKYENWELLLSALLILVLLFAWRRNGFDILVEVLILILGARGIRFKNIIKVYAIVSAFLFSITIVAALTGGIENLIYHWEGRNVRISFGIVYPTDFAAHIFFLVMCYLYLRKEKLRYIESSIIGVLGVFVYAASEARWNTICLLLSMVMFMIYIYSNKKGKGIFENNILKYFLAIIPVLCAAFMTVLTVLYNPDNRFMELMNKLINGRLVNGKRGVDLYGFSFWGQFIPQQGNGGTTEMNTHYFFLDSSYIAIVLQYGLLVLGVVLLCWIFISFRAIQQKDTVLLLIVALISIQCMVEHHMLSAAYNPFIWALFADTSSYEDVNKPFGCCKFWSKKNLFKDSVSSGI